MTTTVKEKVVAVLEEYWGPWQRLPFKVNLEGKIALEAVKRNGDALRYVKEQTFLESDQ